MPDLDRPTVFRVGQPTLGVPVMTLDYRGGALPSALPLPEEPVTGRLARLESRVLHLEALIVALRQDLLDIEFPPPPPPWYRRLADWVRRYWASLFEP